MRYNTVLFDADGTLFDFLRAEREALCETLVSFGIEPSDERVESYSAINDGLWKALERGEIEKEVLRYKRFDMFCEKYGFICNTMKMASLYTEYLSKKGHLIDGAAKLCRSLYGKTKLYIVTNGIDFVQKGRMALSGIEDCFEKSFISGELGYEKPDINYFLCVEKVIPDFSKKDTIIIGDSLTSDIKGGISFGIDTCWYNPSNKVAPDGLDITYIAEDYDEIYKIITGERTR